MTYFGEGVKVHGGHLVPPEPLKREVIMSDDMNFLVLDLDSRDTCFRPWIQPHCTARTTLEIYMFFFLLHRVFYFSDFPCRTFLQQKESLMPGPLELRKKTVAGHLLYVGLRREQLEAWLPTLVKLALMINAGHLSAEKIFVSPLSLADLQEEIGKFDELKGVGQDPPKRGTDSIGTFGSYTTLNELGKLILEYHLVHWNFAEEDADADAHNSGSEESLSAAAVAEESACVRSDYSDSDSDSGLRESSNSSSRNEEGEEEENGCDYHSSNQDLFSRGVGDVEDGREEEEEEEEHDNDDDSRVQDYRQNSRILCSLLLDVSLEEFCINLLNVMSPKFLFEQSYRMTKFKMLRELVRINGSDIGLSVEQCNLLLNVTDPWSFIVELRTAMDQGNHDGSGEEGYAALVECVRRAIRRCDWDTMFREWDDVDCVLNLTAGISWEVPEEHKKAPFPFPLYSLNFKPEDLDRGMQKLQSFLGKDAVLGMDKIQREIISFHLAVNEGGGGKSTREGGGDDVSAFEDDEKFKYPLLTQTKEELVDMVSELSRFRGDGIVDSVEDLFASNLGVFVSTYVLNALLDPKHPQGKAAATLLACIPSLVDRHDSFAFFHLNSMKNPRNCRYIVHVNDPFDDSVAQEDGLLVNDHVGFLDACHATLEVESLKVRYATLASLAPGEKFWLFFTGPPGTGKTTMALAVLGVMSSFGNFRNRYLLRFWDASTIASLKCNDPISPYANCGGVLFINELNEGPESGGGGRGSNRPKGGGGGGGLSSDNSERSCLMKCLKDRGVADVYRARQDPDSGLVRQDKQRVLGEFSLVCLANDDMLCDSLRDRMDVHCVPSGSASRSDTATRVNMSVSEIARRQKKFRTGHFETLKMLVMTLAEMFRFVNCHFDDEEYLRRMELLTFSVIDEALRKMRKETSFLTKYRQQNRLRVMARQEALLVATLKVLGCVDLLRVSLPDDREGESEEEYIQRTMAAVETNCGNLPLHQIVRDVLVEANVTPKNYLSAATMLYFESGEHEPVFRGMADIVREAPSPVDEVDQEGKRYFAFEGMTHRGLCEELATRRICVEPSDLQRILEKMMNADGGEVTGPGRRSAPDVIVKSTVVRRQEQGTTTATGASKTFDLRLSATRVAEAVLENHVALLERLREEVEEILQQEIRTRSTRAVTTSWVEVPREMYVVRCSHFDTFLRQLRPNFLVRRRHGTYADHHNHRGRDRGAVMRVDHDFDMARLRCFRKLLFREAMGVGAGAMDDNQDEEPLSIDRDTGHVECRLLNGNRGLVADFLQVAVRDVFFGSQDDYDDGDEEDDEESDSGGRRRGGGSMPPHYCAAGKAYVHCAMVVLGSGIDETLAQRLREACCEEIKRRQRERERQGVGGELESGGTGRRGAETDVAVLEVREYFSLPLQEYGALYEELRARTVERIDKRFTTRSAERTCRCERDGSVMLHVQLLSPFEPLLTPSAERDEARNFVHLCLKRDLTASRTVPYYKRGNRNGITSLGLVKVEDVERENGGSLPRFALSRKRRRDRVTPAMAMIDEGSAEEPSWSTVLATATASANTTASGAGSARGPGAGSEEGGDESDQTDEDMTTFPRDHERRYKTVKFLKSMTLLHRVKERAVELHKNDLEARNAYVARETRRLVGEHCDRVNSRYAPFRIQRGVSSVREFVEQDGRKVGVAFGKRKRKKRCATREGENASSTAVNAANLSVVAVASHQTREEDVEEEDGEENVVNRRKRRR